MRVQARNQRKRHDDAIRLLPRRPYQHGECRLSRHSGERRVAAGGFLAGTPDDIIGRLKALEERYPGLTRATVVQPLGLPLAMCLEQLEWFAKDIMPVFVG